jgi:hypothetical protein
MKRELAHQQPPPREGVCEGRRKEHFLPVRIPACPAYSRAEG